MYSTDSTDNLEVPTDTLMAVKKEVPTGTLQTVEVGQKYLLIPYRQKR